MALTYNEIFEYFNETLQDFMDEKIEFEEALERTFGEFETVLNQSESKKAIVYVAYGEYLMKSPKIYIGAKENLIKTLQHLNLNTVKNELDNIEFAELEKRINRILCKTKSCKQKTL